jgi:hypothetical protein
MTDRRNREETPSQDEQMDDVRAPRENEERNDNLNEDLKPE